MNFFVRVKYATEGVNRISKRTTLKSKKATLSPFAQLAENIDNHITSFESKREGLLNN